MIGLIGLFVCGIIGGVFAGMGMGGGTLLIPLLTIIFCVPQRIAQGVNLLVFIPLSVVALFIHFKKSLIKTDNVLWIILPAIATCVLGAFFSNSIDGVILKKLFGFFLIFLSFSTFIAIIRQR